MAKPDGTDADPKGDESKQDPVPPDESQGEDKAPGDGWIKKTQFIAALNNATAKTDAIQRQLDELTAAQQAKAAPKQPTRAELLGLVGTGELTQEQADSIWERQIEERATAKATAGVKQVLSAEEQGRRVASELRGYRDLVPDAWVEGSPERAKAAAKYQYLVDHGSPPTNGTELAALNAAFGDIEVLRASKSARSGSAETQVETGGGKPEAGSAKDVLKTLSPREKEHYEKGIKAGRYKDWGEVKAELDYAKPETRRRMGAKT